MQVIKEDIKRHTIKPVYLLYGSEDYLKKLYQEKLKRAVLDGSDEMNYSYFEGKHTDVSEVVDMAETLPFFSERRLLILKDTGWFKAQSAMTDAIAELPASTVLVFVESEVDKRNRLYKKVKELGHIAQMDGMDERNLKLWISSLLAGEGKKLTEKTASHLIARSGPDMKNLQNELEKLICFAYDREVITEVDIDAVCTVQVTGKIFQMIDAIALHKQREALAMYYDLLTLREKPMTILFLITRQFHILLQMKELESKQVTNAELAKKVGIPPFAVKKNLLQAKNFTLDCLYQAIAFCIEMEESVKTGKLEDKLAVELLIVRYSQSV